MRDLLHSLISKGKYGRQMLCKNYLHVHRSDGTNKVYTTHPNVLVADSMGAALQSRNFRATLSAAVHLLDDEDWTQNEYP